MTYILVLDVFCRSEFVCFKCFQRSIVFTDTDSYEGNRSTSLMADVIDDSSRPEFTEVVPLASNTDGPCTTDCDSGDQSARAKQEILQAVKQEPENVCCS